MIGIALILNPSMKKAFLTTVLNWEDGWVRTVEERFLSTFQLYKSSQQRVEQNSAQDDSVDSGYGYIAYLKRKRLNSDTSFHLDNSVEEEYIRYLNAPQAEPNCNVLDYWKFNQSNFPILAAMAKDFLTVQASSVPSERAFSSGTDLVTAEKCSLSGKTIEMPQFLKFSL